MDGPEIPLTDFVHETGGSIGPWIRSIRRTCGVVALGVAAAALASPPDANAARNSCPVKKTRVKVALKEDPGRVKVNRRHSQAQLTAMMRKKSKIRSSREMLNNGLTRTKYGTNMGFELQYAELKSGKVCAALRTVDATFGYAEITVFIARKYKKGSCQYRTVLQHENTHVAIHRKYLTKYADRMRRRLTTTANKAGVIFAPSVRQAKETFRKRLEKAIDQMTEEFSRELDAANARIDTPENYRRENKRCPSW